MEGLNPCCDGRWSRTSVRKYKRHTDSVLILVVMEDGLVHTTEMLNRAKVTVLILVVMEDGLVHVLLN